MTERERIIASMSPVELAMYRNAGGRLPRVLVAVADASIATALAEAVPNVFSQKRKLVVPVPHSPVPLKERKAKRRKVREQIHRVRRRAA